MDYDYDNNPRTYALDIGDTYGFECIARACLHYMSADDVRGALDDNELSPRFLSDPTNS